MYIALPNRIGQSNREHAVTLPSSYIFIIFFFILKKLAYTCSFCNCFKNIELIFRYTHIEAECAFITFDDLLDRLEDLICDVVERVLQSPFGHLIKELNPNFQVPKKPFKRMNYSDAIKYLRENNIRKEDGSFYEFGEV